MVDRSVYTLETLKELVGPLPLYGVIGFPVAHSKSPEMQMAAFNACQRPARYVRIEVPPWQLPMVTHALRDMDFCGWNCTVPHKIAMLKFVQTWDDSVERARALNTVVNLHGELRGYSTDGTGWVNAVREAFGLEIQNLRILILGAGGSGQTLARESIFRGCRRLMIANRSLDKAEALVRTIKNYWVGGELAVVPWEEGPLGQALLETDLLVNTTSVGLKPEDPCVIPSVLLHEKLCVFDLVYQKQPTPLVAAARQGGARAVDGLGMLLHQGAAAFSLWTGLTAPIDAMRQALIH